MGHSSKDERFPTEGFREFVRSFEEYRNYNDDDIKRLDDETISQLLLRYILCGDKKKPPIYSLSELPGSSSDDDYDCWPEQRQSKEQSDIHFLLKKDDWIPSELGVLFDDKEGLDQLIASAISAGRLQPRLDKGKNGLTYYFDPLPFIEWAIFKELPLRNEIIDWHQQIQPKKSSQPNEKPVLSGEERPWLVHNPDDPEPKQPWYIPARYFARAWIKDDVTLLNKRSTLAKKVAESLKRAGIKNSRGSVKFDPGTVLKAFSNVNFG